MVEVRARRPVARSDRDVVAALARAAESADGHPSLGDGIWRDLSNPGEGSLLLLACEHEEPVGALHLVAGAERAATAAMVVHPEHRHAGVATALVDAAVEVIAAHGGGHLALWALGADHRSDAFAAAAGFTSERELWQMRVTLPLGEAPRWPPGVQHRSFAPGRDEAAWLVVNNRAFAHDPDQGEWTEDDLRRLEGEDWFDPDGFLLAVDHEDIAGFCWTRVHPPVPPHEPAPLGEIFVVGVDPAHQRHGLGRALVVEGLASLHARGMPIGMLFVDATNGPAVALYRALGFEVARVDRAYGRDVP